MKGMEYIQNMNEEYFYKLLPFELKTGKESPYNLLPARAQLALYTLMLADRYDTAIEGGLLYFLKTRHFMVFRCRIMRSRHC